MNTRFASFGLIVTVFVPDGAAAKNQHRVLSVRQGAVSNAQRVRCTSQRNGPSLGHQGG
jgi:hypothetical protein